MNFLEDLLAGQAESQREIARAHLRVAVTEALLEAMEAKKVSKAELARKLGLTRAAITQGLTGRRNLSLNTLADIAQALDLDLSFSAIPKQVANHVGAASARTITAQTNQGQIVYPGNANLQQPMVLVNI